MSFSVLSRRVAVACLLSLVAGPVRAADVTKADNTDALNLTTSWTGGVVPTATDVGLWDSTVTSANTVALGGNLSWQGIRIADPFDVVSITSGNTLTLGTSGIDMSAATADLSIASGVTLGAGQSWTVGTGRALTVSGAIGETGGAQGLTKAGAGSLTLTGGNSYTGATTVSAGSLLIGNGGSTGSLADASDIDIAAGATVEWNRSASDTGFANAISGTGTFVKRGGGELGFTGASTFSGLIDVQGGKLGLNNAGSVNGSPSLSVASGATLSLGTPFNSVPATIGDLSGAGVIDTAFGGSNDTRTLSVNQTGNTTFSGSLRDAGTRLLALEKNGTGTLTLDGASTATGGTTINAGTLEFGTGSISGGVTVNAGGTLLFNRTTNTTFANDIAGTGSVRLTNAGSELTLTGNNSFSGTFTVDSGERLILRANAFNGAPQLVLNGRLTLSEDFNTVSATVSALSGSGEVRNNFSAGGPRVLVVDQATNTAFSGSIINDGNRTAALTKAGVGTLTLSGGSNAYAGNDVTIDGGTLQIGAAEASTTIFNSTARTVTVNSGATLSFVYRNAFGVVGSTPNTAVVVDGGTVVTSTGSTGAVNVLRDLTLRNGATLEATKDSGSFRTYQLTGTVTVDGTSPSSITTGAGNGSVAVGNGSNSSGITIFDVADVTGSDAADLTVSAAIGNSGSNGANVGGLTKTGAGTMLLGGINTYTGATAITAGTLIYTDNNNDLTGGITVDSGATLQVGNNTTAGFIGNNNPVTNNGSLVFFRSNASNVGTVISGTGSLTKLGADRLGLNSANTYTGATTISSGTLALGSGGSLASELIDIASGAFFDVSLVTGFALGTGQRLAGAGSILGDLEFGAGSTLTFSTTDTLTASSGTISFTPGFGIADLFGLDGTVVSEGTYTLISGTVDLTGMDNVGLANRVSIGGGKEAYFASGSLNVVVVPEPGTLALAACGLALAGWQIARRRKD